MGTINQSIYEEGLEEFLQFGQHLLEVGLDPYLGEISGQWKASIIGDNLRASYQRFVTISNPDFCPKGIKDAAAYQQDDSLEKISGHLSEAISEAVFEYYSLHGKGVVFVIDFRIFKKDIENKLLAIRRKRFCF